MELLESFLSPEKLAAFVALFVTISYVLLGLKKLLAGIEGFLASFADRTKTEWDNKVLKVVGKISAIVGKIAALAKTIIGKLNADPKEPAPAKE